MGPPTSKAPISNTGPSILERICPPADPKRLAKNPPRTLLIDGFLTPERQTMKCESLTVKEAIADGFIPDPPEPAQKGKGMAPQTARQQASEPMPLHMKLWMRPRKMS
jgi:hypothetical protein